MTLLQTFLVYLASCVSYFIAGWVLVILGLSLNIVVVFFGIIFASSSLMMVNKLVDTNKNWEGDDYE